MRHLGPQTLTAVELQAILRATAAHPRDHLVFSLALGTGLRLGELVGLDVGDLYFPHGVARSRVTVRAEIAKRGRTGDLFLPDALFPKVAAFWRHKAAHHERLDPGAPLFCGLSRRRISKRRVQVLFRDWQKAAGLDRHYPFHALRHTAVTNVYRASRDLFLAQRFARHASPLTTVQSDTNKDPAGALPTGSQLTSRARECRFATDDGSPGGTIYERVSAHGNLPGASRRVSDRAGGAANVELAAPVLAADAEARRSPGRAIRGTERIRERAEEHDPHGGNPIVGSGQPQVAQRGRGLWEGQRGSRPRGRSMQDKKLMPERDVLQSEGFAGLKRPDNGAEEEDPHGGKAVVVACQPQAGQRGAGL